ncbi:MAG: GGDEF domain-containing protein, partial [Oscillospiraceae bacterium]
IALIVLDYIIRKSHVTTTRAKYFFRLSIFATIIAIIAEISSIYFENASAFYRVPNIIVNMAGFSVSPLIPLLTGCAISNRYKKGTFLFWIPAAVNFAASFLSSTFPIIFSVNADNVYTRGGFFGIYIAAYGAGMAYLFLETLAETIRHQNKNRSVLFILFLFLVFGTSVQVAVPQLRVSWLCVSFATGLYYTYYCELYYQIDALTGLLNRHAYERYICKTNCTKDVAILFFNIDDFKSINDEYGHPFGDYCLVAVSSQIKDTFSKIGLCFRIGGDEFCVISRNTDKVVIQQSYQKFLDKIVSIRKAEMRLPLVSIGYSFYDKEKGTIDKAISEADWQMYCFKQSRENR